MKLLDAVKMQTLAQAKTAIVALLSSVLLSSITYAVESVSRAG